jgi:hypothetical protein
VRGERSPGVPFRRCQGTVWRWVPKRRRSRISSLPAEMNGPQAGRVRHGFGGPPVGRSRGAAAFAWRTPGRTVGVAARSGRPYARPSRPGAHASPSAYRSRDGSASGPGARIIRIRSMIPAFARSCSTQTLCIRKHSRRRFGTSGRHVPVFPHRTLKFAARPRHRPQATRSGRRFCWFGSPSVG